MLVFTLHDLNKTTTETLNVFVDQYVLHCLISLFSLTAHPVVSLRCKPVAVFVPLVETEQIPLEVRS